MTLYPAVKGAKVATIRDNDYFPFAVSQVRDARLRCLCSVFIVDPLPRLDKRNLTHSLLLELAAAAWKGVDVRVIVGGTHDNSAIQHLGQFALATCRELRIPARILTASDSEGGTHVKLVIIDDVILGGSHNWSAGAFGFQVQDSIAVNSPALASFQAAFFEEQWLRAQS